MHDDGLTMREITAAVYVHARVGIPVPNLRHVEYFHDRQRIERMLFDGALDPAGGVLTPDPDQPGLGWSLRDSDAERYRRARFPDVGLLRGSQLLRSASSYADSGQKGGLSGCMAGRPGGK